MRIKKGDRVKVITGAYKGTIGEVTSVFPKEDKVIVEGVNMVKKHQKSKKASRIRMEIKDGKKVRVYKTSGKEVKGK